MMARSPTDSTPSSATGNTTVDVEATAQTNLIDAHIMKITEMTSTNNSHRFIMRQIDICNEYRNLSNLQKASSS